MTVDNKRRYDAIANELEQIRKDAVQEIIVKPKENNKNNPASPATSTTSSIINNSYNTNVASSTTQSVFNLVSTSSPLTNKPGLPALAPIPQKPNLLELYNNR
ncbi:MAG: hypothetical protein QM532_00990 [Cyanobium sp. MAG06]|nr:hypothetical protein [Cyanobium sp. MAG06]